MKYCEYGISLRDSTVMVHKCKSRVRENDKPFNFLPFGIEQRTLRNVNNYLNANIYSYLETSGCQSSNLYLKVVHFFDTSINYTSVAA